VARAVEVPQLRRFASDSGGVEMEMEGKIYTVWGPKGLRRFFAQNLPGGLIVREVNRQ